VSVLPTGPVSPEAVSPRMTGFASSGSRCRAPFTVWRNSGRAIRPMIVYFDTVSSVQHSRASAHDSFRSTVSRTETIMPIRINLYRAFNSLEKKSQYAFTVSMGQRLRRFARFNKAIAAELSTYRQFSCGVVCITQRSIASRNASSPVAPRQQP
jgi:hypothetical protein